MNPVLLMLGLIEAVMMIKNPGYLVLRVVLIKFCLADCLVGISVGHKTYLG